MQLKNRTIQVNKTLLRFIYFFVFILSSNAYGKCTSVNASFKTSETIICGPGARDISLVNTSTGTEAETADYNWYLNGVSFGKTTGLQPPAVSSISDIGTYAYMLVATDKNGCKDTSMVSVFIHPIPIANFTVTGNSCGELIVNFKNISSGTGAYTVYSWDFGDGSKSAESNPVHTYKIAKSYLVSLTVQNGAGCRNVFKDTVTLSDGPLPVIKAKDKDGDTNYCLTQNDSTSKDTVDFYNLSLNAQSYRWDFGDGSPLFVTSSKDKITHVYANYGTYKVTLLAIADGCEKSTTLTIVFNRAVQTLFSLQPIDLQGCLPHRVTPVNTSLNGDVFTWNFGDGTPLVTVNNTIPLSHVYLKKGIFVISLKVSNSCNSHTITSDSIRVEGEPVSKMQVTPMTGCAPQEVIFKNESSSPTTNWEWSFGDGTSFNGSGNPQPKIYKEGKWKIILVATNACGKDTAVATIKINSLPSIPVVKNKTICFGDKAKFEVDTVQGVYQWFDAPVNGNLLSTGISYTTPELKQTTTYYVQCKSNACVSERIPVTVQVLPLPDPPLLTGASVCKGNSVALKLDGKGNYEWFNMKTGGTCLDTTATFNTPPLIINTTYYVQVKVGMCKSLRAGIEVKVLDLPKASFEADTVCIGIPTLFKDISTENPTMWSWDFGDAYTSRTGPEVKHTYDIAGSYIAKLMVANTIGCRDSVFQRIVVNDRIKVGINAKATACIYDEVELKDNSVSGNDKVVSSTWDFGDGFPLVQALDATHIYNKAGTYQITHQLTSDKGCVSELTIPFSIAAQPIADFSTSNTCQIQQSIFNDQSKGNVTNWEWDFGDGLTSIEQHPKHAYAASGYFTVKLIAKTDAGCADTSIRQIVVYTQPIASFTADTVCWGDTTAFNNTSLSVDGNIEQVTWNFDDGTTADDFHPKHVFVKEKDIFYVTMEMQTSHGCRDTITQRVYTNPLPVFHFFSKEKEGCETFTTTFYDSSTVKGGKIISWLWDFGDGNLTYRKQPIHSFDEAGNYEVSLKVATSYGCEMIHKLEYPIVVYPQPKAAFVVTPDELSIDRPTVQLMDYSTDGSKWDWDFGDHKTSIERNPFHTYSDTGTFVITQIVINDHSCTDTAKVPVRINTDPGMFIPNVFTPNNDELNDVFVPVGKGIADFHMLIFDRWGNLVFETNDFNNGWNGRRNGADEVMKQDVYIYRILVKDVLKKTTNYTGSILLRLQ